MLFSATCGQPCLAATCFWHLHIILLGGRCKIKSRGIFYRPNIVNVTVHRLLQFPAPSQNGEFHRYLLQYIGCQITSGSSYTEFRFVTCSWWQIWERGSLKCKLVQSQAGGFSPVYNFVYYGWFNSCLDHPSPQLAFHIDVILTFKCAILCPAETFRCVRYYARLAACRYLLCFLSSAHPTHPSCRRYHHRYLPSYHHHDHHPLHPYHLDDDDDAMMRNNFVSSVIFKHKFVPKFFGWCTRWCILFDRCCDNPQFSDNPKMWLNQTFMR